MFLAQSFQRATSSFFADNNNVDDFEISTDVIAPPLLMAAIANK